MARFELRRRTVLRGLGTMGVALPGLEIMAPARQAQAAAPANRYVLGYSGFSIGTTVSTAQDYQFWRTRDMVAPQNTGPMYQPTLGMQPAFDQGVTGDLGIVSGLKVPWGNAGSLPPGGRVVSFHGTGVYPQVTGLRSNVGLVASGPSADQLVAKTIYAAAPVPPKYQTLPYMVQAPPAGSSLPFRDSGAPITPVASPRVAYEQLFGNFTPVDSTSKPVVSDLMRRKSVVDLVLAKAKWLSPKLGTTDRLRMESHFDQIRDLERRLRLMPPMESLSCKALDPVKDPPKEGDSPELVNGATILTGYGGEELRADLAFRFLHMAFACDMSRVGSVQFLEVQSVVNLEPLIGSGWKVGPHTLTHTYDPATNPRSVEGLGKLVGWHVKHLASFVKMLRDTPDADGSSLLDHTALAMLFEGGHGFDPEGSKALTPEAADPVNRFDQAHSSENMAVIVAGRAGGLKAGQHIHFNNDVHPAQVVLSTMRAVGWNGGLGDFAATAYLPELFR